MIRNENILASLSEALSAALNLHMNGRLTEAETLYGRILDAVPDQADALHLLGLLLAQTGRMTEGLARIKEAISINPAPAPYHLNCGKIADALGRHEDALISYGHALLRQAGQAEAEERIALMARLLAERSFDAARFDEAVLRYRRALALAPSDLAASFDHAIALKRCGRLKDAAHMLMRTGVLEPALERVHVELAGILEAIGDFAGAAEAFTAAAAVNPADPSLFWAAAVMLQRSGAVHRHVITAYRYFLSFEPGNPDGWSNLCLILRCAGDRAQSVQAGRRAVTCAPVDMAALVNLGAAQLAAEDPKAAVATGRFGVISDPGSAMPLINLGAALTETGALTSAELPLVRALRLTPGEPLALAQLGRVRDALGKTQSAIQVLRLALATLPTDEEGWASLSRARLQAGDSATALACARRVLCLVPGHPRGALGEAMALEAEGEPVLALASYDRAIAAAPGLGTSFTRRALLLLRPVASPPAPRISVGRPRLMASRIGNAGRFGNQLLQYAFLRAYAERTGLELETPEWIGRSIYGFDDPLTGPILPTLHEDDCQFAAALAGHAPDRCAGHDIVGYFCGDTTPFAAFRERIRNWFQPVGAVAAHADAALAAVRERGQTVVAIHLRRGDFGGGRFWIAPESWYLDWLERIWSGLDRPVLYIATDAPHLVDRFTRYAPLQAADLTTPLPGAEFFTDHWILSQSDALAVSNSSFSVTAAMLNARATITVRPHRQKRRLVSFDPWAGPVLWD